MKLHDWGGIIVSWASFLNPDEEISSLEDLKNSLVLTKLLRQLENLPCHEGDNDEFLSLINTVYPSLDCGPNGSQCEDDTIVRATAFLIFCSLHHGENELRKQMTKLSSEIQQCFAEFLRDVVDTPKEEITRDLIFSEISKIKCLTNQENLRTPSFHSPLMYSTSPSTGEGSKSKSSSTKKTSKMRKIKNELEELRLIKAEQTEELEALREAISNLETLSAKKDQEINTLKRVVSSLENNTEVKVDQESQTQISSENTKLEKLQNCIETLEQEKSLLNDDLQAVRNELEKLRSTIQDVLMEKKYAEEEKCLLENQIEDLKSTIEQLEETNKEQSDYIEELTKPKGRDSGRFSDSFNDNLSLPESLGTQVVDLEVRELRAALDKKENDIRENSETIKHLKWQLKELEEKHAIACSEFNTKEKTYLQEIESKMLLIKSSDEDMRSLECQNMFLSNTIQEKDSIIVSMQSSLDSLGGEIYELKNKHNSLLMELQAKETYSQEILREREILLHSIAEKDEELQGCLAKIEELQNVLHMQIQSLQAEIQAKSEELNLTQEQNMQLVSTIESLKGQIFNLEYELNGKDEIIIDKVDLINKLESDIGTLKQSEKALKCIINDCEIKINDFSSDLTDKQNLISSLDNKMSVLIMENRKLLTDKNYIEEKLSKFDEKTRSLEEDLIAKVELIKIQDENRLKEINELTSVNQELRSENDQLKESLSKNSALIESYNIRFSDLDKEINLFKKEAELLNDTKIKLSEEVETYKNKFNEEASKLVHVEKLLCDKEELLSKANKNLEEITERKEFFENRAEQLELDLLEVKEVVTDFEKKAVVLDGILREKDHIIDTLKLAVSDANDKVVIIESTIEAQRQDLEALKGENKRLTVIESEHNGCEEKVLRLESLINELKDKEAIIKEKLAKYCEWEEHYKSLIEKLEKEKEIMKHNLNEMSTDYLALKDEHALCSTKMNEVNSTKIILKEKLRNISEKEGELKSEVSKLKGDLAKVEKDLVDKDFELSITKTTLQAKEAELNKLKLELGDISMQFRENKEKHDEDLQMHLKKIHDLDNTMGKLNNQFIKLNREKEALVLELDDKNIKLQELKNTKIELDRVNGEKVNLEKELSARSEMANECRSKLQSVQDELNEARQNVGRLQSNLDSKHEEVTTLSGKLSQLKEEMVLVEKEKGDLLHQISTQTEIISELKNNMALSEKSKEEIKSLKNTMAEKDIMIEKLSKEKEVLEMDLDFHFKREEMLSSQMEMKDKEIGVVRSKFLEAEAESSRQRQALAEKEETLRSLYATLQSQGADLKGKDEEISALQLEIKSLNKKLLEERQQFETQVQNKGPSSTSSSGQLLTEREMKERITELKSTYEKKVDAYKATLKKRFAEKLEDLTFSLQNDNSDLKEKLAKEQERCAKLQSELWNASDKLLIAQEQNRTLLTKIQSKNVFEVLRPSEPLSPISKARSMEVLSGRNRGIDNFARDISLNESTSSASSRRASIRSLPRGMGKVFPAAEEDGEVFDNRNLAELKAGICNIPVDQDRMSQLQYRNSLCPPHLKSSYPAETQFFQSIKEEEIKIGLDGSSESESKKTKAQPTERACTSTPRSVKEGVVNECFVLRESSQNKMPAPPAPGPSKVTTPSRIRALFTTNKKDENSPRRKSMFKRH